MAPDILRSLCSREDTTKLARSHMATASAGTGKGSGREVASNIIPPICAFIASEQLANGDVSKKTAQLHACVKAADFENALAKVRQVLAEATASRSTRSVSFSYETLLGATEVPQHWVKDVVKWMELTERELVNSDGTSKKKDLNTVKCAVFKWTTKESHLGFKTNEFDPHRYSVDVPTYKRLLDFMDDTLHDQSAYLKEANVALAENIKAKRTGLPTRTKTRYATPSPSVTATPSKSALRNPTSSQAATPSKGNARRHSVAFEEEVPGTPSRSKRQKKTVEPSSPNKTPQASRSSTRNGESSRITTDNNAMYDEDAVEAPVAGYKPMTPYASVPSTPSKRPTKKTPGSRGKKAKLVEEDDMDVDLPSIKETEEDLEEEDEEEEGTSGPRRFRPVFSEQKQWGAQDPRLAKRWTACRAHVETLVERYGDPLAPYRHTMDV